MYPNVQLHIAGEWRGARSGKTIPVVNPATEEVIGQVAHAEQADLDEALEAAERGFAAWRKVSAYDRAKAMRKAADLLRSRADAIARLMTQEQGKPLAESKGEIAYGASFIEWFGEEAKRVYGETIPGHMADKRITVLRQPIGVVASITPWNFPIAIPAWKSAPALAFGNTVVIKPAGPTPAIAAALAEAGASLEHVTRTRVMLTDVGRWREAAAAHAAKRGERLAA